MKLRFSSRIFLLFLLTLFLSACGTYSGGSASRTGTSNNTPSNQPTVASTPTPTATRMNPTATPTPTATRMDPVATPTPTITWIDPVATPTPTATRMNPIAKPTPTATRMNPTATPTIDQVTATPTIDQVEPTTTPTIDQVTPTPMPVIGQVTPTITGISPLSGPSDGGTEVTITGSGFTSASSVSFGGSAGSHLTINSDTQITVDSPAGSGTVDITVTLLSGISTILPAAFTYT